MNVNLFFFPKKGCSEYQKNLSDAFKATAELSLKLESQSAEVDNVILWASKIDIKKFRPEDLEHCSVSSNNTSNNRFTDQAEPEYLKKWIGSDNIGSLESGDMSQFVNTVTKGISESIYRSEAEMEIKLIDENKKEANPLVAPLIFSVSGENKQSTILVMDSSDLESMHKFVFENNLLSEEENSVLRDLLPLINPDGEEYLSDIGQVNDIAKLSILALQNKIYKGRNDYLDIDVAQRLKAESVDIYKGSQGESDFLSLTGDSDSICTISPNGASNLFRALEFYRDYYKYKSSGQCTKELRHDFQDIEEQSNKIGGETDALYRKGFKKQGKLQSCNMQKGLALFENNRSSYRSWT